MNLIPDNNIDGAEFRRPSLDRAAAMSKYLHRHRILTKLRQSAGQDIAGACGQLRARSPTRGCRT
jgi:23S rRNA (adenine2503-C2)-methyltransferase